MVLAAQALRELCASDGCLEQDELQRRLLGWHTTEQLARVLVRRPGGGSGGGGGGGHQPRATVPGARCGCPEKCGRLHVCKYHVKGLCRNQLASCRKECKFVHDFYSDHNLYVLKQYGLENLNSDELRQLLLQNDPSLLPEVCSYYNKGDGPYGSYTLKRSAPNCMFASTFCGDSADLAAAASDPMTC